MYLHISYCNLFELRGELFFRDINTIKIILIIAKLTSNFNNLMIQSNIML